MIAVLLTAGCSGGADPAAYRSRAVAGAEAASIVGDYGGLYRDEKLAEWLTALGRDLAAKSGRPDLQFSFNVLDSAAVNAFSTPTGAVYVTRGLLALANGDAEIAAVLGHEIGHAVAGDWAERTRSAAMRRGIPALLAGLANWVGLGRAASRDAARFSEDQEFAADEFAIRIEAVAGYDPRALPAFLETVDRAARAGARSVGASGLALDIDDVHPLTSERIARARRLAALYPPGLRTGRDSYLRAVDGMIFGDSPEQGYARGDVFIHPRAGFLFNIPPGFTIDNSPAAIVCSRPDGALVILTSAAPGVAATPYDYLTEFWMKGQALSGAGVDAFNGHPAALATAPPPGGYANGEARLAVVGWSPSIVYRWVSLAPDHLRPDAKAVLLSILDSFRAVAPADLASLRPFRLKIVKAKKGDSIATLSRLMRLPPEELGTDPESQLRVLNGFGPSDRLSPGQLVKVVE